MKNKPSKVANRITGAGILAVIMIMVFIQRTNLDWIENAWALLFLIPAIASINNTITEFQNKKGFTFSLASNLVGIIFPIAICVILLLGLEWTVILPIIILLAGFSMFVVGFVNQDYGSGKIIKPIRFWFFSWGAAVMMIGVINLAASRIQDTGDQPMMLWYGIAILVAASGGILSSYVEFQKKGKISTSMMLHLLIALGISIPGILALLQ